MTATIITEFGWFGFGRLTTALFPGIALGVVRLSWTRGALADAIKTAVGKK